MDGTFIGTINFSGIYPVIAWVIFLGILLFLRYKQKKKMSGPFLFFLILFFAYLCRVVYWTQGPIFIGDLPIKHAYELKYIFQPIPLFNLSSQDINSSFLYILLAVPYGFLLPFLKKKPVTPWRMLWYSFLFSFSIEAAQLLLALLTGFTIRVIDVNDLIFNTLGGVIGYGLFRLFLLLFRWSLKKCSIPENSFLTYISQK